VGKYFKGGEARRILNQAQPLITHSP